MTTTTHPREQAKPRAFHGYHLRPADGSDEELTRVDPGTPAGEYLRRFWHPVALAQDVGELPVVICVLGETLVLFRDKSGRYGLVHRNCPHRNASLEYGICEDRGIRCCYHGWHFDIDGTILEVPAQPPGAAARIMEKVSLGAYRAQAYRGLLFAYMGPPEEEPMFPIYDTYEIPDLEMVPYRAPFHCNWLQVLDGGIDPVHTSFLHSRVSRSQFSDGLAELGELKFVERHPFHLLGTNTRRVGDHVWVRTNEIILPNFSQAGAAYATDGTATRYYGRSSFTRWIVPLSDTETEVFGWANFGDRGDPQEWNTPEGIQMIEQGEVFDRPYETRQRYPADLEACEGMGAISAHRNEHLVPTDRGVTLLRQRLRAEIRAVRDGRRAGQPVATGSNPIPTYGGDTVLRLPARDADDRAFLRKVGSEVVDAQIEADSLAGDARDTAVIGRLKQLEAAG
jgi:phenylpropionate dioxygenase-like ring-hydroxylating dioxygenase large terminal subunit